MLSGLPVKTEFQVPLLTEVVGVTARGLRCVRGTRAVLSLCVVWVCGLQLTGWEEDRRALGECVCLYMCVCTLMCLLYLESRLSVAMAWLESPAFCHSTVLVWKINTHWPLWHGSSRDIFYPRKLTGPERPLGLRDLGLCNFLNSSHFPNNSGLDIETILSTFNSCATQHLAFDTNTHCLILSHRTGCPHPCHQ